MRPLAGVRRTINVELGSTIRNLRNICNRYQYIICPGQQQNIDPEEKGAWEGTGKDGRTIHVFCFRMEVKKKDKLFTENEIKNGPSMNNTFYFEQQALCALQSLRTLLNNAPSGQQTL
jgi:hypothetical protein